MVAMTVAAGLALGVAGCGSGGDDGKKPETSSSATENRGSDPSAQEGTDELLAELKGEDGLILSITSAQRDSGGFVTVSGEIKNDGAEAVRVPIQTRGDETEITRHGESLGGATLVDSSNKKRYYVLRDTDGRPLTTTDMPRIKPGASIPVFMQFPSPPTDTAEVTFQLPTFASAAITISG
ncbi:putative secreted protein [Streptomyces viridochromogenes Tue57]|uniref:Putative secreted protein n=2 Tax=Streptomyces viridochromogenes TaxID=1938 RepID=L8PF82_STRVR|nr:putative secreted protein [Streptomyces viridochromogenes Tue57]